MSLDLDTMRRDTLQELEDTLAEARRLIDQADRLIETLRALGLGV